MLSLLCVGKLGDNRCVRLSVSTLTALPITTQFGKRGGSPHKTKKCRLHITRVTTHLSRLVLRQLGPGSWCSTGCALCSSVWCGRQGGPPMTVYRCTVLPASVHTTAEPVLLFVVNPAARRAARLYRLYRLYSQPSYRTGKVHLITNAVQQQMSRGLHSNASKFSHVSNVKLWRHSVFKLFEKSSKYK